MSSFKYKTNRTKYRSDTRTLNEMHLEYIKEFQKKRQELPNLEHKYKKFEYKIQLETLIQKFKIQKKTETTKILLKVQKN